MNIDTVAGTTWDPFANNLPATQSMLSGPSGLAFDASGNLYVSTGPDRVRRVEPGGNVSTFAGSGLPADGVGDGLPAAQAQLVANVGLAYHAGNLYIADVSHNRIRRVAPDGIMTTLAGAGTAGYSGDGGPASLAALNLPRNVAVDSSGNVYINDRLNNRIRVVAAGTTLPFPVMGTIGGTLTTIAADTANAALVAGTIWTVAGTGAPGFNGDNIQATASLLTTPLDIAFDPRGEDLCIASNNLIRKVARTTGVIAIVAGGHAGTTTIGSPIVTGMSNTSGLSAGTPVFGTGIPPATTIVSIVPNASIALSQAATISGPMTLRTTPPGSLGDGGLATSAPLNVPRGMVFEPSGAFWLADSGNNVVRRVDASGTITTYAGGGNPTPDTNPPFGIGDGLPATQARLSGPGAIAVDGSGNLYIADSGSARVRVVAAGTNALPYPTSPPQPAPDTVPPQGTIWTVAGGGAVGFNGDTDPTGHPSAMEARFNNPRQIALDPAGNLYFADHFNHRIRRVDVSTGSVSTFAGTGIGFYSPSDDGGPASASRLNLPIGIAVRSTQQGLSVYIGDLGNGRVRKVDPAGVITTVAGNGTVSQTGTFSPIGDGGPATSGSLFGPGGVALDEWGNMYIADSGNRVRAVAAGTTLPFPVRGFLNGSVTTVAAGTTIPQGSIWTLAGTGTSGFSGDGNPATQALVNGPQGVVFDSAKNLYVVGDNRIRVIAGGTGPIPSPTSPPQPTPDTVPPTGTIWSVAGTGSIAFNGDTDPATGHPLALEAGFNNCHTVAFDAAGNMYTCDNTNRVRRIDRTTGYITTIAGNGVQAYAGDGGPATAASIAFPFAPAFDDFGNLYVTEAFTRVVRRLDVAPKRISVDTNVVTVELDPGRLAGDIDFSTVTLAVVDPVAGRRIEPSYHAVADGGVDPTDAQVRTFGFGSQADLCGAELVRIAGRFTDGRYFSGNAVPERTAPVVTFGPPSPAANANGWWNAADVTVPFTASPSLAVAAATPPTPLHFTTDGAGLTQVVTIEDNCGGPQTVSSPPINRDTAAPAVGAWLSSSVLWPPYHQMWPVVILVAAGDSLSGLESSPVRSISVTSSEPDVGPGTGASGDTNGQDGYTQPVSVTPGPFVRSADGKSAASLTLIFLRAERAASNPDGRVYGVTVAVADGAGNETAVTRSVVVPHARGD